MLRNILEYLEQTVGRYPDKLAFANEEMGMTFREVSAAARSIGTALARMGCRREPVVLYMKRHPHMIAAFWGVVYSGCFYVPIDEEMPEFRVRLIFENLKPRTVICDGETAEKLGQVATFQGQALRYEALAAAEADDNLLAEIRREAIDTDPVYIVFTSGSTGVPKGVVACHRSVIDYAESLMEVLQVTEESVFANQTPLYFDACLKELFGSLKCGATTYLVPRRLFLFPIQLVEFLNEHRINTVCWVVSALTMISSMRTFDKVVPKYLHTVAFGSEVFPIKQFNLWRKALPKARFINLYGPTEATGMSCYYEVDRAFEEGDVIPIGRPFRNTGILLLDEQDRPPAPGEPGEICIRGTPLTLGYYNNREKTDEVFVQNPLNHSYHELIYRIGDIGRYNERGGLLFLSRKDNQIRHVGHRVELGEIQAHVDRVEGVRASRCLYDKESGKIVLFYAGEVERGALVAVLKGTLPRYMIPNQVYLLPELPLTANGKVDRQKLRQIYQADKENKRRR